MGQGSQSGGPHAEEAIVTMSSVPDPAQEVSATSPVPPPLDPELAAGFAVIAEHIPRVFTLDMISSMRQQTAAMPSVSDEQLSRGGAFEISERRVPGPAGAP